MVDSEFDRQINRLLQKNYPRVVGMTTDQFLKLLEPLKEKALKIELPETDYEQGYIPFVIVVKSEIVPSETAMSLVQKGTITGFTKMEPSKPDAFKVIHHVNIPNSPVYLLVDIDRGKETLNIKPSEALKIILNQKRSPLTIDEGIAIATHYPEFLKKNNCISLLASRANDQKVPAIWITGDKRLRLGWCWNGNPHTWLGSASCKSRIG